jgi:hypothetical protein
MDLNKPIPKWKIAFALVFILVVIDLYLQWH